MQDLTMMQQAIAALKQDEKLCQEILEKGNLPRSIVHYYEKHLKDVRSMIQHGSR